MASDLKLSIFAKNTKANALGALLNGGYIRIYSGAKPTSADTAVKSSNKLLVEMRFKTPAFRDAVNGKIVAYSPDPVPVLLTGTATWFRWETKNHTSILDGTVGISGCDLNVATVNFIAGGQFSLTTLEYTEI